MANPRVPVVILALILVSTIAQAQWVPNGIVICDAPNIQGHVVVVPDGQGGAILVWNDYRNIATSHIDVYAQRVNQWGYIQWANNGLPISTATLQQRDPVAIPAVNGDAIIAWTDLRDGVGGIYAQRVDINGNALWTPQGVVVSNAVGAQVNPVMVSDYLGGAIIAWEDDRNHAVTIWDVYAQRIDANGASSWTADGVPVCAHGGSQGNVVLATDGQHGAHIAWLDNRDQPNFNDNVFAQRINATGVALWAQDGIAVTATTDDEQSPAATSDEAGGVLLAWDRGGEGVYAQRINAAGVAQWTAGGKVMCSTRARIPSIVVDDDFGAIVAWSDLRDVLVKDFDVYAGNMDDTGGEWGLFDGIPVVTLREFQGGVPKPMVRNAAGEWMIVWEDDRDANRDIYAHKLDVDGNYLWPTGGVPVTQEPGNQARPAMTPDGAGGAYVAWEDSRNQQTSQDDIYATRIGPNGGITAAGDRPVARSGPHLSTNAPNPFGSFTDIRFELSRPAHATIDVFDVAGHRVFSRELGDLPAGPNVFHYDGHDDHGAPLSSGGYFYRIQSSGQITLTGKFVMTR